MINLALGSAFVSFQAVGFLRAPFQTLRICLLLSNTTILLLGALSGGGNGTTWCLPVKVHFGYRSP